MRNNLTTDILEKVFFVDGSLRDIYIQEINLEDWQKLLNWTLLSYWDVELYIDGKEESLEKYKVSDLFEEKKHRSVILSLSYEGILLNCHFSSEYEVEFNVDPKQIKSLSEANTVVEFMKKLSGIFHKEVFLTIENSPEYPLIKVKSDGTINIF